VIAVVAANAENLRGSNRRKKMKIGEWGGFEVDRERWDGYATEDSRGEVLLRGLHGKGRPKDAVALFDQSIP
jgi:hypothetical protein